MLRHVMSASGTGTGTSSRYVQLSQEPSRVLIRGAFEMAKTLLHSTAELDDGVLCAWDRMRLPRVPANLDTIRRRERLQENQTTNMIDTQ